MDSLELANMLNMQHFSITRIIDLYKKFFEVFGELKTLKKNYGKGTSGGRPYTIYILNENQKDFVIILLKNTPESVGIKAALLEKLSSKK